MGVVLARQRDDLAVELVLDTTLNQHRHGFRALVADHAANQGALEGFFSFRHYFAPWRALVSARMVLARAMSRRAERSVAVLVSCCVAFCMRRPKWAFCSSLTSVCRPATSFLRSSVDLVMVIAPYWPIMRLTKVVRSGSLADARRNAS